MHDEDKLIGVVISRLEPHKGRNRETNRGYIGMLAVDKQYRGKGLGQMLVAKSIKDLIDSGADEIVLETESDNTAALRLYQNKFGFLRDKKLSRYYNNGKHAYRLKLWLR